MPFETSSTSETVKQKRLRTAPWHVLRVTQGYKSFKDKFTTKQKK